MILLLLLPLLVQGSAIQTRVQCDFTNTLLSDSTKSAIFCLVINQTLQRFVQCNTLTVIPQGELELSSIQFTMLGPVPDFGANDTTDTLNANLHNAGFFYESISALQQIGVVYRPVQLSIFLAFLNMFLINCQLLAIALLYWVEIPPLHIRIPGMGPMFAHSRKVEPLPAPQEPLLKLRPSGLRPSRRRGGGD